MKKTKNELSCDTVHIDYQSLIDVARYALHNTINVLISTASTMRNDVVSREHRGVGICIQASGLESTVEQLIIAAETHHALVEGIARSTKILINIPEGDEK